jgi:hypothetical protein
MTDTPAYPAPLAPAPDTAQPAPYAPAPYAPAQHPQVVAPPEFPAPRGPGATAPFPAPPTEGRSARVWWGVGAGALAVVLFCGGGTAALIGLATVGAKAVDEQATVVVGGYFDAVRQKRYDDAYGMLCEQAQDDESPGEFSRRIAAEQTIRSYDVGTVSLVTTVPVVPVKVVYDTGDNANLQVSLRQDRNTGEFEVCGVEE